MISKQGLQYEFPDFNIHEATFASSRYYFLIKDALHYHLCIDKVDGSFSVLVFIEGELSKEIAGKKDHFNELIKELKTITKEYDITDI